MVVNRNYMTFSAQIITFQKVQSDGGNIRICNKNTLRLEVGEWQTVLELKHMYFIRVTYV